jgi:cytochrome c-type biogenesis protein CcmH
VEEAIAAAEQRKSGAVPAPPSAASAAVAALAPGEQQAAIRSMVDGLAQRLQANPTDGTGWRRLGRAYRVLGEPAKAAEAYGRAAALAPDDPVPLVDRAEALETTADGTLPPAAAEAYRKALSLDPNQPQALWSLGQAEAAAHHPAEARVYWARLLKVLEPGTARYAEVERSIAGLGEAK